MSVGRFRPIATASMGALTSIPPPVKRTVGFVVVDMALAAATKTAALIIYMAADRVRAQQRRAVDHGTLLNTLCAFIERKRDNTPASSNFARPKK